MDSGIFVAVLGFLVYVSSGTTVSLFDGLISFYSHLKSVQLHTAVCNVGQYQKLLRRFENK
ncbi:hypothetical protein CHS0354_015939 [Potamilus streckersoni]|uniref:Uncharacterized protein n=1 Tax=Potamilus streckersoni TaxID=2493646 RepID=A0AAE0RQN5_9BIVA|nr:hypothetical protein CHS0354_015939 [Potamilus streckersoni]